MGKPCPRYDQLFKKEMQSHEVTDEEKKNKVSNKSFLPADWKVGQQSPVLFSDVVYNQNNLNFG